MTTMADRALQHRRLHNILLIQKLLTLRSGSSPFTLLLDSVEQSANPLVRHYIYNAKVSKIDVVFVSFENPSALPGVDAMIKGRRKSAIVLQKEIVSVCSKSKKILLIIDTLHTLASQPNLNLPTFLSSLLSPHISLIATYHLDVPIPLSSISTYAPHPLTLLNYLATALLTVHSFTQTLARKRAADKSLSEPLFGIAEEREGVVVGMGANDPRAMVVEMEYRRKSGRGVKEWFFLPLSTDPSSGTTAATRNPLSTERKITLLEDHPLYHPRELPTAEEQAPVPGEESTFELGLTAKQRVDREGVVLPYFDAQKGEGGEGGRIIYEMGVEDDFDEEEDEI